MSDAKDPSTKPGEANGAKTDEIQAAEVHPSLAKKTNPVAEAVGNESKDPYAEGQKIKNPEPNNGLDKPKAAKAESKPAETKLDTDEKPDETEKPEEGRDPADQAADDKAAETVADQNEVDAKASTPDANLPDEDKTAPANQVAEGEGSADGDAAAPEAPADPATPASE